MNQLQIARRSAASNLRKYSLKRGLQSCGAAASSLSTRNFEGQFGLKGIRHHGVGSHVYQEFRGFSSSSPQGAAVAKEEEDIKEEETSENSTLETDAADPSQKESAESLTEKRKRASRRKASQSVPYWLKTESFAYERTMSALNLSMSQERHQANSSETAISDLSGQTRKAFVDSIPSFCDMLKSSDNLPLGVKGALDRLAEAGFDDEEFSKNFRDVKGDQMQFARITALLEQKQQKYQKRQETARIIERNIKELEDDVAALMVDHEAIEKSIKDKKKREESPPKKEGRIRNVISMISKAANMVRSENNEEAKESDEEARRKAKKQQHDKHVLEQKMTRFQRQIAGRRSHLEEHAKGTQHLLGTITELKREHAKAQSSMTSEVYKSTQKVVQEGLLVLCDFLADHIQNRHSKLIEQYQNLDERTDLTKPHEWYPWARLDKRKIIYHGGPTNSGKTYTALQRLKKAERGMYLGPLRLLAAEVYEKLNSEGVYCSLRTGQEQREFPFATHIAATVEMAASLIDQEFDVLVIDEIQMIIDDERGFAWTRALMGMRCKEIHVCGGLEAKKLVERLVEACGDEFELQTYDRFSALEVASTSLASREDQVGSYGKVQPGDCVVAFSRTDIFTIQREIEEKTNYKCCVVYGTLPPEIRTTQAKLFNDPDSGYDILVASDAISMGLNLNIRRIIFNSIYKNDGKEIVRLGHSAVKQIAGRAGRRNSPFPNGEVTCRDPRDLQYIQECLGTEIKPIERAGLVPSGAHVESFGEVWREYQFGSNSNEDGNEEEVTPPLHRVVKEFQDMSVVKGDFFLCRQDHIYHIAKLLKDIPLETETKYNFTLAPINIKNQFSKDIILKYAQKLAAGEVPGMMRSRPLKPAKSFDQMGNLCAIYSEVELFIWLQNKFPPVNFMEQRAALSKKESVQSLIAQGLREADKLKLNHCYVRRDVTLRRTYVSEQQKEAENDEDNFSDFEDDENEASSRTSLYKTINRIAA